MVHVRTRPPSRGPKGHTALDTTLAPLDREAAQLALLDVCAAADLDPAGAELIRLGSNAVFRLRSAPLIVRIGPNSTRLHAARREVAVAEWLADNDVPAIRIAHIVLQPLSLNGRVATIWQSASDREQYGTTSELAAILRKLHALSAPTSLDLPALDPFTVARQRITTNFGVGRDRDFMNDECDRLSRRYDELDFVMPAGVIHGDASVGNVIRDDQGHALLSDLDGFSTGPLEWDLVLTAMYFERYGWHTLDEYRDFVLVYGYDVMDWSGYEVMRDTRELLMVAWLAQKVSMDPASAPELEKRIHALRTGGSRRDWRPL
jgi:aminoglycoside phosphotransferase (APT) family kinase protein